MAPIDHPAMLGVALAEARKGLAEGGIPIGAAIFDSKGELVGSGHNRRVQNGDPSLHGETDAFRNAGRQSSYRSLTMVTTLAPCWYCSGLIRQFGFGSVVVGESRNFQGGIEWLRSLGVQVVDLDSSECASLLSDYIRGNPALWNEDIGEDIGVDNRQDKREGNRRDNREDKLEDKLEERRITSRRLPEPGPADRAFMARAIQLALENVRSGRGGPFGAVIAKHGNIVAEAANQVTAAHDPTAHAEVLAIRQACQGLGWFELKGCDLYSSCEPCPMCLGAIYWARIDRVYFGTVAADAARVGFEDSAIYAQLAQPRSERKIAMVQMMRDEALAPFRAWERTPGKILY